jgi:GDP-6-deoxy-D-talose 4-dehydrogenase
MARLWMERLPIVLVRPFNYTGPGQAPHFLLPKIVDHFRRGAEKIELGNLDVARDFSDVRTVVAAYRRLIERAPAGETFNVCSGKAVSLEEVLALMADIAGYHIRVRVNPAFVRENEVERLRGSNAKLVETIGALNAIPLEQTLRWMFEVDSI